MKVYGHNNKVIQVDTKWLEVASAPIPPEVNQYTVYTTKVPWTIKGKVKAVPCFGDTGTEVTLSNTPDEHYHCNQYLISGASLKNTNQFDIETSDVSVTGIFEEDPKYTVSCSGVHGTVNASPSIGYTGTEVTLSNAPDTGYEFQSYTLTGATLKSSNKFDIGNTNVYVVGNFSEIIDYNPLGLPANTIRVRTSNGNAPYNPYGISDRWDSCTKVSGTNDQYDVYKSDNNWEYLFQARTNIIEVLGANTANVTSLKCIFDGCTSLTTVSLFDTRNVTTMQNAFANVLITSIPAYDTSNVTTMSAAFKNCTQLTTVPLFNTSKVTDMNSMFQDCYKLTTVPLFDTSNVTNMQYMFYDCKDNLESVPLFDTSKVTNMYDMFYNCNKLTSLPLFDTSKVTNMGAFARYCTSIRTIPAYDVSSLTNVYYAFASCTAVNSGAYDIYQRMSALGSQITNHIGTFYNCGNSSGIPSDWKSAN